jgi:hypothetical protein
MAPPPPPDPFPNPNPIPLAPFYCIHPPDPSQAITPGDHFFYGFTDLPGVISNPRIVTDPDMTPVVNGEVLQNTGEWLVYFEDIPLQSTSADYLFIVTYTNTSRYPPEITERVFPFKVMLATTVASGEIRYPPSNSTMNSRHVVAYGTVDPAAATLTYAIAMCMGGPIPRLTEHRRGINWVTRWTNLPGSICDLLIKVEDGNLMSAINITLNQVPPRAG